MALRFWRRSAFRRHCRSAHRLRPALGPDCTGAALPRARVPVARRRARRRRRHAAAARRRSRIAVGTVRRLRPRRVHHGVGSPPSPAARHVQVPAGHALRDSGKAMRDGLTGWPRRHDSADPAARARVFRGLLRLVGHPRFNHVVDWRGRPGTHSQSASATPAPRHRWRVNGDWRDPRRSAPSSLDPRVGSPHRLAPRRPRRRPRARSPVRHGARGDPRGKARAGRLLAPGRRLGRACPRTRPRVRGHERVGRHRHGGRGGLRSLLGDCCCARRPHRGCRHAAASLFGSFHRRGG